MVKKATTSNLNCLNRLKLVNAIKAWAVSLLWYTTTVADRRKTELTKLGRITRKVFNINEVVHRRVEVVILYLSRKGSRQELISVGGYVELTSVDVDSCVGKSEESLFTNPRVLEGHSAII